MNEGPVIKALRGMGFNDTSTGGGCTALELELAGLGRILVTAPDARIPEAGDDIAIGFYDAEDDTLDGTDFMPAEVALTAIVTFLDVAAHPNCGGYCRDCYEAAR